MSQSESFIDEVTEEVRRDQLFAMMRRYGWIAVLLVLVLVGGAAWNEWRNAKATAAAQAAGDAILAALESDDSAVRMDALAALPATPVAALLTASEQQQAGDNAAAAATLMALADDATVADIYRDIARFKAVLVQADTLGPDEMTAAFGTLVNPGAPLRLLALEQIAVAEARAGDTAAALERLDAIIQDAQSTRGLRDRIASLIVALGGELTEPAIGVNE